MPDELLTVAEVAEVLKINQQTVRNWNDAGRLPARRDTPRGEYRPGCCPGLGESVPAPAVE